MRQSSRKSVRTWTTSRGAVTAALALIILGSSGVTSAADCTTSGVNAQCTLMGSIRMDAEREVKGNPINVITSIVIDDVLADSGTRWVLFAVRNLSTDGESPVSVALNRISTPAGPVPVATVNREHASELDLWVLVLDVPLHEPITLNVTVGSSAPGLFRLETLVEAFDRHYAPIPDATGVPATLFSYTRLAVTRATPAAEQAVASSSGGFSFSKLVPAASFVSATAVLTLVAFAIRSRRVR